MPIDFALWRGMSAVPGFAYDRLPMIGTKC